MKTKGKFAALKWTARIIGTSIVLITVLFFFGYLLEGYQNTHKISLTGFDTFQILTFILWFLGLAGLVLAWWKEGTGGFISFFFTAIFLILVGTNPGERFVPLLLVFLGPSLLYIIYWWLTKKPFFLSGKFSYRIRSLGNFFGAAMSVSIHRLLHGPKLPGWTLIFETSMRYLRHQSEYAYQLSDIRESRKFTDSLVFRSAAIEKVHWTKVKGPIKGKWYVPPAAREGTVILYLHGGGYAYYSRSHYNLMALVALATGSKLLAPDYRLAPEHPFPAQIEDAKSAYRWLLESGYSSNQIILAGDSAGGNLVLALLVALKDEKEPLPAAAVCIAPWTDLTNTGKSMEVNDPYDWIDQRMADKWAGWYCKGSEVSNPLISPRPQDMKGMPPIYIQVGTAEILYDMIETFCSKAREHGADVRLDIWEGMTHDFQAYGDDLKEAIDALGRIGRFADEQLRAD